MVGLLLVVYVIWNEKEALKHLTASASGLEVEQILSPQS